MPSESSCRTGSSSPVVAGFVHACESCQYRVDEGDVNVAGVMATPTLNLMTSEASAAERCLSPRWLRPPTHTAGRSLLGDLVAK